MYRDGSNYKAFRTVVLAGRIEEDDIKDCLDNISNGVEFIPYQVGLDDLQPELASYPSADDHVWHEFESAKPTDLPPTKGFKLTAAQLLNNFRALKGKWDVVAAVNKHGL
jgi:hypothetical protein